jgi:hypothetical protein
MQSRGVYTDHEDASGNLLFKDNIPSEVQAGVIFDAIDQDGNGNIDMRELAEAILKFGVDMRERSIMMLGLAA